MRFGLMCFYNIQKYFQRMFNILSLGLKFKFRGRKNISIGHVTHMKKVNFLKKFKKGAKTELN